MTIYLRNPNYKVGKVTYLRKTQHWHPLEDMAAILQHRQVGLEDLVQLLRQPLLVLHAVGEGLQVAVIHLDHGREQAGAVLEHPVWDVAVTAYCLVRKNEN